VKHTMLCLAFYAYSVSVVFAVQFQRRGMLSRSLLRLSFSSIVVEFLANHFENKIPG